MKPELWAIAEIAIHRASLLAGDCDDQFLFDIDRLMLDFIDTFGVAEKIRFDIIFFAVVADIEILKAKICIGNDFAGVGLCNRSHFLEPPLLFYLNFGDEPIV